MRNQLPIVLGFLFLAGCASPAILNAPAPEVGSLAPPFTLQTPAGESVSLHDLRGQVVLVNFWATWCVPCRIEMPIIQERYDRGGFAVLMIDFDETAEQVDGFMEELGLDLPVLLDPGGTVRERYRVRGLPSSFFVDERGVIRVFHIGEMSREELDGYLAELGVFD